MSALPSRWPSRATEILLPVFAALLSLGIVASAIANDPACQAANFYRGTAAPPSAIRSSFLVAPTGQEVAWSVLFAKVGEDDIEMIWSRLLVRNRRSGLEHVLAETRFGDDFQLIALDPDLTIRGDAVHELCAIDWSPDGRALLVRELVGPLRSDNISEAYWVLWRTGSRGNARVDLKPAVAALKAKQQAMGRDPEQLDYSGSVVGWQQSRPLRLIVQFASEVDPTEYWTVAPDGSDPRHVADVGRDLTIATFGRRISDVPAR